MLEFQAFCTISQANLSRLNNVKQIYAYILEVSSPGLTRPLKKEKDFKRSIGKVVEIKTFAKVNGAKEFEGVLKAYDENTVTIELEDETEITITRKDISMIRLAFIY